ncbi:50S ribosomal protein L1 [Candidatus Aerophobetes bacterium]|uniref:Large ribosomal subunit protein uL1 n=1 Tax=Aerophobetes bacterium TaxID=2030807 RepID=A0A2A4X885_UNCAE|nr:MAG: 50S ribosomal protein L1 [Candidatus Aerophobetes bacterium]
MKLAKRQKKINEVVDISKKYSLKQAVEVLKKCPPAKFDESIELSLILGVDPKKSDQQVRGTVSLPSGTGKSIRIVALCKGDNVKKATEAGADHVGDTDIIAKIKGGWTDFDVLVVTPDMMRDVGKLGKILGPRGLMPSPKGGTVTTDIAKAIDEVKKGKIEFKVDKNSVINSFIGKLSFTVDQIMANLEELLSAIIKAKPSSSKGVYMKGLYLSTTMGPGINIDVNALNIN